MPEIMLYNTATRQKERLDPLDPDNVRMYVCGPTVYDRAHIGNARPAVVFDVLFRLLRHEYGAEHVTYVRNITDVDDKINARAAATKGEGEGELDAIRRITDETVGWYREDMAAIGNLAPTHEPRATDYIGQMVAMIEALIARGNAYAAEGHVLFEVAKDPKYGSFANRNLEEMRAGARVEVAPYKRDPMDFVLWKPSDAATPGWESPWGRGRPGWHIECSAMARALLGESFDIHGGGIDLAFPHHENEIAQSRCAHPEGKFAKIWMHNGFLQVEGEKMSKSAGNFFTVWDLRQQMSGMVMRHVLLSSHYRSPLDWTETKVKEAKSLVGAWINRAGAARRARIEINGTEPVDEMILAHLADDLDTHAALQRLNDLARNAVPQFGPEGPRAFLRALDFLGFELKSSAGVDVSASFELALDRVEEAEQRIDAMARRLDDARAAEDFTTADRVRTEMEGLGVRVQSTQDGTRWERTADYDPRRILYEAEQ